MKKRNILMAVALVLGLSACQKEVVKESNAESTNALAKSFVKVDLDKSSKPALSKGAKVSQGLAGINALVAEHGLKLEKMEFLAAEKAGSTVFFEDRGNKQLSSDYVPFDPRNGNGADVPYVVDGTELGTSSGMTAGETLGAIMNSMNTWNNVTCSSGLDLPFLGMAPFDIGFVQYLLGFGGSPGYFPGMITHAGVLPKAFFDAFEPGGGDFILGVTFTFVWEEDLDQDGRDDVAIKEIYMNDDFNWQDAPDDDLGNGIYDFETVVTHEVGHGLSQAHFGKVHAAGGKLHFSPAALMNAGYTVARREVTQTDNAGHCSNWGDWPNH